MGGRKFHLGRIRKNLEKNQQGKQKRGPGRPMRRKNEKVRSWSKHHLEKKSYRICLSAFVSQAACQY